MRHRAPIHRAAPHRALALLLLASCGAKEPAVETPAAPEVPADPELTAFVASAMNPGVDPCVDFYEYACGGWIASTPLPGDEAIWARSFSEISKRNRELLRALIEDAAANPGEDPVRAKVGAAYGACMDEPAIEAAGLAPLKPHLDAVEGARDRKDLLALAGKFQRQGVATLFYGEVYPDFTDPKLEILHVGQGGLGLPDRDYYLREGEDAEALRQAYRAHIARMLVLSGVPEAKAAARAELIYGFELKLAEISWPRAALRDPVKTYNKIDRAGLQEAFGKPSLDPVFETMGYADITHINVMQPDYFKALGELVRATDVATLKHYMGWHLLTNHAQGLSAAFAEEDFNFYGRTIAGQKEMKPRWRRCVEFTQAAMGEAVGQLYVAEAFAGDSKDIALELIHGIEEAFEAGLPELAWMDDETRERARQKVGTLVNKIGYPDAWRDYSALAIGSGHFDNTLAATAFEFDRNLSKVGGPVDAGEWYMPPQVVNAYYNPLNNEMVFPAGILQPPFFDADYPAAMNFGGIGMVMGHELTHGFDDTGRQFGPDGAMSVWWNESAIAAFEERAQCVVDQYAGWSIDGTPINGELTLGENIADLGGVKESLRALRAYEAARGPSERRVEGLSSDQLFFVAFAQGWCSVATPEVQQLRLTTDSHSPPKYRVNGPLINLPEFAEAFSCAEGTPMHPAETCEVW